MEMKHKFKDKSIKLASKRGKPIVDRLGFIQIIGGGFNGIDKISKVALKEQFTLKGIA